MADDTSSEHHHDENLTSSTKERWEYIGTVLAALVVSSLPVLVLGAAYGVLSVATVGQAWFGLYATVVLMASTWTWGKETLQAVREVRGK